MKLIALFLFVFCSLFAQPPKVVVFDYGGVMAHVNRKPVLEFLSKTLEVPYSKVKNDFHNEKLYQAFNQPNKFWEKYGHKKLSHTWHEELQHQKNLIVHEIAGMRDIVLTIKNQGIQVALLSNTNKHRARFLESMGGYDLFDPILLSCHLNARKPEPKIYKILFSSLHHSPKECLFIDNKPKNIQVGKSFGMDGIVFESPSQLKTELRKRDIQIQ